MQDLIAMKVTKNMQEILADIFENSERPDKMKLMLDKHTRSITIVYEDLDDEWFKELKNEVNYV